ncbi:hypothetical protein FIB49_01340 [Lactococcus cremoris]|uniref:SnoaL-like domain-containing protein n=1 Tax=Lactococcus lactis subsp. cremoris TaxID=1359 RepID=A0AA34TKH3_LACLC|nr:hypothetical protein [Lactococcus cremoris]ARE24241.1 hypothetical protein LLJM3_2064 [Lactococcus cremoris]KZK48001.1 hypothetical protein SK110_0844 [Lactococcus cremoris]MCT4421918.1 hypothetical protein [Lactococcus cremoris]MCT4425540.1 hypothetical protein [Lactococcus cremoris]TNU88294.1 hypothetical protein FIB49_01340 [Lactococcus cremoris]
MTKSELFQQTIDAWLTKDINKSYVDNETCFFTWTFHYVYKGEENIFDGISLVKFSGNKICQIQEFEQKHEKFRPFLK